MYTEAIERQTRKDMFMSEKQDLIQPVSAQAAPQPRRRLTLVNSLIILVIIYLATGTVPLFLTSKAPASVPWLELGQWILIIIWLLIGVRPPFMAWLKQTKERKE